MWNACSLRESSFNSVQAIEGSVYSLVHLYDTVKLRDLENPLFDAGFLTIARIQVELRLILCQNSYILVTMATRVGF